MSARTPRIGVVGLSGGWSSEALADAVETATGYRLLIEIKNCVARFSKGELWYKGTDLCQLDGIIVKKIGERYSADMLDRLELLRFAESRGVRVFSSAASIIGLLDRLSCTVTLAATNLPMPDTTITENLETAVAVVKAYEGAVLKPLFSTKARGMQFINCRVEDRVSERVRAFRDAGNPMMYIQKKVELPGRDLGVVFLGGEYVGTYARMQGPQSWNTTKHDGGRYEKCEPPQEVIDMAWRAQAPFGLDMTGVDIVETEQGPLVFEVSAFGGFRGMREALGSDAAKLYAEYAVKKVTL